MHVRQRDSMTAAMVLGLSAGAAVVLKPNAGLYFPALLLVDRALRVAALA